MEGKINIEQLIVRYLNGECSNTELSQIKGWIVESKENKERFYQIKDVWDALLQKEDRSNEALLSFYKQQALGNQQSRKVVQLWRWVSGVAVMLVVAFLSLLVYNFGLQTGEMVTLKVPMGSRSEVILADGSQVILNSGSEMTYPQVFSSKKREVALKGEAFFKVKSDKLNPFVVQTDNFDVHVTGTSFNVCSYSDNDYSSLTLAEGKVNIHFAGKEELVKVMPGERFKLDKGSRNYSIKKTEVGMALAWKDGEFRFKEIGFPELMKRLERWYDVTLVFSVPEMGEMVYSGNFRNQETIWQVLDALKLTTPIDYQKVDFRKFKINYQPM